MIKFWSMKYMSLHISKLFQVGSRGILVYTCYSGMIINSILFHSHKGSSSDAIYSHPKWADMCTSRKFPQKENMLRSPSSTLLTERCMWQLEFGWHLEQGKNAEWEPCSVGQWGRSVGPHTTALHAHSSWLWAKNKLLFSAGPAPNQQSTWTKKSYEVVYFAM